MGYSILDDIRPSELVSVLKVRQADPKVHSGSYRCNKFSSRGHLVLVLSGIRSDPIALMAVVVEHWRLEFFDSFQLQAFHRNLKRNCAFFCRCAVVVNRIILPLFSLLIPFRPCSFLQFHFIFLQPTIVTHKTYSSNSASPSLSWTAALPAKSNGIR